jgi:hypothetical protein
MNNWKFTKIAGCITILAVIIAAGMAVSKVRAQTTAVQPFTAVEVHESLAGAGHGPFVQDGTAQNPAPYIYTKIVAVRSDGSVAITQKWVHSAKVTTDIFMRMVVDATAKTHLFYDPLTQTIVVHPFDVSQTLRGGGLCSGTPDGQIEGFDVVRNQDPLINLPDGEEVTETRWSASKLGCFTLREEKISMHEGQMMFDVTRSVTNIKLGEPDAWYFAVPTGYTTRTGHDWDVLAAQAR